jgi:uncharacterized protein (DUF362 family)
VSDPIDRRKFIRNAAVSLAALSLAGRRSVRAGTEVPGGVGTEVPAAPGGAPGGASRPSLVLARGPGVRQDLDRALARLLAPLGGMAAFVRSGQSVVLKPNLGFPNAPEVRATTSPWLTVAVVRAVQACGARRILIADYPCRAGDEILTTNRYAEALKGLPVEVLIASEEAQFADVAVPRGRALKRTKVLRAVLEADVHIALPVAKSHGGARFTGVLKGAMGVIWDRRCFHGDLDLDQAIADLATAVRPHLSILEGIEIMADGGPKGPGTLLAADSLVAGTDPVAVDAAGVKLVPLFGKRMAPRQIGHLALAVELGVGRLEPPAAELLTLELPAA